MGAAAIVAAITPHREKAAGEHYRLNLREFYYSRYFKSSCTKLIISESKNEGMLILQKKDVNKGHIYFY